MPADPIRTPGEMLEAVCEALPGVSTNTRTLAALRARIAPEASRSARALELELEFSGRPAAEDIRECRRRLSEAGRTHELTMADTISRLLLELNAPPAAAVGAVDTARLDWLEQHWHRHGVIDHITRKDRGPTYMLYLSDWEVPEGVDKFMPKADGRYRFEGPTLRAVIDAARAALAAAPQPNHLGPAK